ncbi:MAG: penicillin-binding protein [Nitrospirae bacterium]|nr:penicillin-binding protein [Nitrospirota bacterium]
MKNGWRNYQGNIKRQKNITKKSILIISFVLGITFLVTSSAFLGGTNLPGKFNYSIQEDNLNLKFTEDFVRIEGGIDPLFTEVVEDRFVSKFGEKVQVVYTVDPVLQEKITSLFERYKVPYGAFVAISPKTGKILAMVGYSEKNGSDQQLALRATYPAASVFKLVTAAAALEKGKVEPETVINFRGGFYSLSRGNWTDNPKKDKNKITLADAMGKSCNVALAKVALRWLKADDLLRSAEKFGFNNSINFELPVQQSSIHLENSEASIARTAAGFGNVTLSPLHGAMMAAAIANDGRMVEPRVVEKIFIDGREAYNVGKKEGPAGFSRITAEKLRLMMQKTVTSGTARHAFHTPRGDAYLKDMEVGGKTGSLLGNDPQGDYSWFIGMAPLDDPEIAIAALVINRPTWQIKAPFVAREGLLTYFNNKDKGYAKERLKVASLR